MENPFSSEYLDSKECSRLIGCSLSYLYKMTSANSIPHYKFGNHALRFKRDEVQSWLETRITKIPTNTELAKTISKGGL